MSTTTQDHPSLQGKALPVPGGTFAAEPAVLRPRDTSRS